MDKGIGPNVTPEKQVIRPVVTPQTHILSEIENISCVKQRIDQGRAGIKEKTLRFPVFKSYGKPEQPKLLPGRKPIIQIAERPILQHPQNVWQSKTR